MTLDEFKDFIALQNLREFILQLKQMSIKINFGRNKRV